MILADMKIEDIKIGMRVFGYCMHSFGTITNIEYDFVTVIWEKHPPTTGHYKHFMSTEVIIYNKDFFLISISGKRT